MRSIERLVRLVVDRRSAEQVEQQSQEALDRGTDPRQPERNLGRVEGGMDRLRRAAVAVGGAIAAAFAVRRIARFAREAVSAAEEITRSRNTLRSALEAEGVAWEEVSGWLQVQIDRLWETHRLTEGDVLPSIRDLFLATGDLEQATRGAAIAADLAATGQMNQQRAARMVGRVLRGDMGALERYNIELDENRDVLEQLEERYGGLARESTTALDDIRTRWSEFRETVGLAILDMEGMEELSGEIVEVLQDMEEWVERNADAIVAWGRKGVEWARRVVSEFGEFVEVQRESQRRMEALRGDTNDAIEEVDETSRGLIERWRDFTERWPEWLHEVNIALRELAVVGALVERVTGQTADDLREDLETIRQVNEEIRRERERDVRMPAFLDPQFDVDPPEPPAPDPGPALPDAPDTPDMGVGIAPMRMGMQQLRMESVEAREQVERDLDGIEARAESAGRQMTRGFESFFDSVIHGFQSSSSAAEGMAQAVQGVGRAMVGALSQGLAEYHHAQGVAKLAEGTWPPNPAAISSAMKHFAAAGLFQALPGLLGGGGRAGQAGAAVAAGRETLRADPTQRQTPRVTRDTDGAERPAVHINVGEARDPISLARDRQWLRAHAEAERELAENGDR